VRNKIAFNGMFWNVQILLIQVMTLISIILWVLNAILFSAAFRHIPFGCESCASSGQTKVQRMLNVPERLVYALYNWRDLLPFMDHFNCIMDRGKIYGNPAQTILINRMHYLEKW